MNPVVLARYASKSNPSKSHEVRRGKDGVVYCTCPSWRFQHNSPSNRTCKHIECWKAETKVPGSNKSLADVLGPGPEAIRPVRRSRKPKTVPATVHGVQVELPVGSLGSEEPEWGAPVSGRKSA